MSDEQILILPRDLRSARAKPITYRVAANGCWICTSHALADHGYPSLFIKLDGKQKGYHLSRYVYLMLKGEIPSGMDMRHLCGNRGCINSSHLEFGTRKDNMQDAVRHGTTLVGTRNPHHKLTWEQVEDIRRMSKSGLTQREIAKNRGVDPSAISRIVNNLAWKR